MKDSVEPLRLLQPKLKSGLISKNLNTHRSYQTLGPNVFFSRILKHIELVGHGLQCRRLSGWGLSPGDWITPFFISHFFRPFGRGTFFQGFCIMWKIFRLHLGSCCHIWGGLQLMKLVGVPSGWRRVFLVLQCEKLGGTCWPRNLRNINSKFVNINSKLLRETNG